MIYEVVPNDCLDCLRRINGISFMRLLYCFKRMDLLSEINYFDLFFC